MSKPAEPQHRLQLEESAGYDRKVIDYVHHASATGLYEIRGLGAKRHVPHFDDLVFLGTPRHIAHVTGLARIADRLAYRAPHAPDRSAHRIRHHADALIETLFDATRDRR